MARGPMTAEEREARRALWGGVVLDLVALASLAMIGAGAWMIYPPAGLLAPGGLLFAALMWRGRG